MNAVSMYKFIEEYNALLTVFGINSSLWDQTHCSFSPLFFRANRESLIGEYLTLKSFVERAQKHGFTYYLGIDEFLRVYKDYVYSKLNL